MAEARSKKTSLRGIAKLLNQRAGPGKIVITHRIVQLILTGKEPHNPKVRAALGLPVLLPAPACPVHGVVHTGRCPRPRKRRRDWLDWPVGELAALVRKAVQL